MPLQLLLLAILAFGFLFASGFFLRLMVYFTAGLLLYFCAQFFLIPTQEAGFSVVQSLPWSHSFGLHFDFRLDGTGLIMATLISGIGAAVYLYAYDYLKGKDRLNSFFATLTVFTLAMYGMVHVDNFILFFVFWELTSLCSFHLVGFNNAKASTRQAAKKALLITVFGGLFLLIGFILVSLHLQSTGLSLADSMKFSSLSSNIRDIASYPWIVFCFIIAVATKSALFPFHIWLPGAMAGPTPVSSYLHSATMVKAGIFLLCKLHASLGGTDLWFYAFTGLGSLTMLMGAYLAASQRDIKKILAYSTISVLGILTMLLGIGTEYSIKAVVVFLVAHALYKASLFQIIGNIDYATGSRDIKNLGQLGKVMPLTAVAALLSTLSMAGSPPLFGFFGKELAYLAKVQLGSSGVVLTLIAMLTNILLVGLALSVCYFPFWKKVDHPPKIVKSPTFFMQWIPLILAAGGLLVGLFPAMFDEFPGSAMATSILGSELNMKLKYWHGFGFESLLVLALSFLTLGLGVLIAVRMNQVIKVFDHYKAKAKPLGPNRGFDLLIETVLNIGREITKTLHHGNLTNYLRVYLFGAIVLLSPLALDVLKVLPEEGIFNVPQVFFGFLTFVPVLLILGTNSYFKKLIYLGMTGLMIVVLFAIFGSYDLALTLLMVETLSIFFLLKMKEKNTSKTEGHRLLSFFMIIAATLLFATILLVQIDGPPHEVASYYLENSLSKAFGKNVVNVILVDFRAFDTFGEVLVIAIAALGIVDSFRKTKYE